MEAIIKFFETLGQAFMAIINFVVKFVSDLVYIVQLLGEFSAAAPAWFTWIPPVAAYVIVLTLAVIVVLRLAGRD